MEENVALDSNKQKQFVKSLKGLKKLMKKASARTERLVEKDEEEKEEKVDAGKTKSGKVVKKKIKPRGLVYLSHIPHGFYENEMTQYFKQFGVVTNARVIRSKRTGRSKGHAFVEFKNIDVAQVVAETMNNYLMGKRLIKAVYIPPKDQRRNARRKNWNDKHNPGTIRKMQMKKAYNSNKSENDDLNIARKLLLNLSNTKSKLKELGIDYDFFTPVDVPETLSDNVTVKKENDDKNKIDEKPEPKEVKANNKKKVSDSSNKNNVKKDESESVTISDVGTEQKNKLNKKSMKQKEKPVTIDNKILGTTANKENNENIKKKEQIKKDLNKKNQKDSLKPDGNGKQQEQKEQKLKNARIMPPQDFIKLGSDDNVDSDSSYEFDSDAYENMVNSDNSDVTDGDDDDSDDEVDTADDDEEDEKTVLDKKSRNVPAKKKNDKAVKVATQTVNINKPNPKQPQKNKRGLERPAVQSKKPKFEKQNNKKLPNKQIKKRK